MDTISNMLAQISNAQAVKEETVNIPFSKLKFKIAKILESEEFVKKVEKRGKGAKPVISIDLKYDDQSRGEILGFKRVSKPGQRIYVPVQDLNPVRAGYGISIVSTSQGVMTDKEAREQGLGGEVLCKIW